MGTIFNKKPTKRDSTETLLGAIIKVATDKHERVLLTDECEWLETKLKEIARLGRILKKRHRDAKEETK